MPGIQIPITQILEKAPEPGKSAQNKKPPCPGFAIPTRKLCHPQVKRTDSYQRTSKCHAIMEHKVNNSTLVHRAECLGCHSKKLDVMRQEVSSRRQEKSEPSAQDQHRADHHEQRPAVADQARYVTPSV